MKLWAKRKQLKLSHAALEALWTSSPFFSSYTENSDPHTFAKTWLNTCSEVLIHTLSGTSFLKSVLCSQLQQTINLSHCSIPQRAWTSKPFFFSLITLNLAQSYTSRLDNKTYSKFESRWRLKSNAVWKLKAEHQSWMQMYVQYKGPPQSLPPRHVNLRCSHCFSLLFVFSLAHNPFMEGKAIPFCAWMLYLYFFRHSISFIFRSLVADVFHSPKPQLSRGSVNHAGVVVTSG